MQPTREEAAKDWARWRPAAVNLFRDTNGNLEAARGMAVQYARKAGYGMVWAVIIAELMLILIKWWISQGIKDPGPIPMIGEPYGE